MKKFIIVLIAILTCLIIVPFSACDKTEKIELTNDNFSDYIIIAPTFAGIDSCVHSEDFFARYYTIKIETFAKKDCNFENVKISCTVKADGDIKGRFNLELAYNGYSVYTTNKVRAAAGITTSFPLELEATLITITGYVII